MWRNLLRHLFFSLVVGPIVLLWLGLNIRNRDRLPDKGPCLLVANHNSHLDTVVLISLFPRRKLPGISVAAAADYFLKSKWLAWFALNIIGIIPLVRHQDPAHKKPIEELLAPVSERLAKGDIVIFFPEGSRGELEHMADFKSGVSWIAEHHPGLPVIPIFLYGLGKALPRGETMLVPFFIDVFVGEALTYEEGEGRAFVQRVQGAVEEMAQEGARPWD